MIFGFLTKKKILVPLAVEDPFELQLAGEKETRVLYAKVVKVSKKKNIFVKFISKDKGEDLSVGTGGQVTALKGGNLIRFPTTLLHRDADVFIFSPPEAVASRRVPPDPEILTYNLSLPVEFRAMATMHVQKGTLVEFSLEALGLLANLPVPAATLLQMEIAFPWRDTPGRMKGKVIGCERARHDPRKYLVRISIEDLTGQDRESLLWFCLISTWKGDA